jgi:hypothetical protein
MLSIRARIGAPRAVLEQIAASGVDLLCGPGKPSPRKAPIGKRAGPSP